MSAAGVPANGARSAPPRPGAPPPEALALLRRRAERLRAAPSDAAEDASLLWAAEFSLGEDTYAIALDALRAAVPLRLVTPVPLSAPHVIGILRWQGQMITAMSLAAMLDASGWRLDPAVLLVVDPGWGALTALDCEQIPKPTAYPRARVEEARATTDGPVLPLLLPGEPRRRVQLIDLKRLLDRRRAEGRRDG